MAPGSTQVELQTTRLESVLAHLPLAGTTEYSRGQAIYGPDRLSNSLYLVIGGKVLLSQISERGSEVLLDIVLPDELFGESAFLDVPHRAEQATVLEKTTVMTWAISSVEDLLVNRPRLTVALLQMIAKRNAGFSRRIESLAFDTVERRLARALIHFSERLGKAQGDGSIQLMALTHELLSRYVCTSREIITQYMNKFRRQGHLSYSRQGITLNRDAINAVLN